jgi:fatty acid-binding protein DegV
LLFSGYNIFSGEDLAGEISKKYGIYSIPFNVLINDKGVIIKKNVNENDLKEFLIQKIEGPKVVPNNVITRKK